MQSDYDSAALALTGLQNYWPLTDGAVSSFADSKGSKTLTSASALGTVTGPDGTATGAAFAGVDNRVLTASSVTMPESHTIAYWMKLNATPGSDAMAFEWNQSAFAKYVQHDLGYTGGITGYTTGARSIFATYYGTATGANASHVDETSFLGGVWRFVVVTFDATQGSGTCMKVYIDGTLSSVTTGLTNYDQPDGAPGTGYLGVGGRNNAGTRGLALDGSLNGVILMSGVMSGSDMTALKNAMLVVGKSASDSATATDASAVASLSSVSASDSATATDTAAVDVLTLVSASDSASATDSGSSAVAVQVTSGGATVTDDFTGTNGTALTSHTPTGSNPATGPWVTHPGSGLTPQIHTNRAVGQSGGTCISNLTDAPSTADYDVAADVTILSAASGLLGGVQGRFNLSTLDGYTALVDPTTGNVSLYCYSGGSLVGGTYLATYAAGFTSGTKTITLRMVGTSIKVLIDGVQRISVTDSNVTTAGHPGIRTSGSSATGCAVDNLSVTTAAVYSAPADAAAATDSGSASVYTPGATTSDSVTATDAASGVLAYVGGVTIPTSLSFTGTRQTIIADTGSTDGLNYNAFPGLCRMPNGKLLAAWHHANNHIGSTSAKIYTAIGTSNGDGTYTWASPVTIATGSGVNLADVGCLTLANGDVMVAWNESSTPGAANINTVVYYKWRKSSDNGATWGTAQSMAVPGFATTVTPGVAGGNYAIAPTPPIQLPNGDLLLLPYGNTIDRSSGEYEEFVKCMKSTDGGLTWTHIGTPFPHTTGRNYDETAILRLDNGTLLAASRTTIYGTPNGYDIWCNTSTDDGVTWGTPYRVLGTGSSTGHGGLPGLIQTGNGAVLLRTRYMNSAATSWPCVHLSTDRGATFGTRIDPYDGVSGKTGACTRGTGDVYGSFAPTGNANEVAYVWCEETTSDSNAVMYFRTLTVLGASLGAETATATDSASVIVGVGATAYITASDSLAGSDSSSLATTILTVSVTATDSATTVESTQYTAPSSDTPTAATPERRRRAYRYPRRGGEW